MKAAVFVTGRIAGNSDVTTPTLGPNDRRWWRKFACWGRGTRRWRTINSSESCYWLWCKENIQ